MYRIGELAELANVTKRTIDYYTKLGLLQAERSPSNYRYYTEDVLADLRYIEECKKSHIPLEEIKEKIQCRKECVGEEDLYNKAEHVEALMRQLHNELSEIMPVLEKINQERQRVISNKLTPQSKTLVQSLLQFMLDKK
ncbi:MerR family transcriptional regulator [Priestia taiwanensis]|uniref:MerR family transcriptional regulator n=1 Tax=Priestia taiwanensis TaxID=1347902 RepID=A0A917AYD5_9BACI|nr:MerR family transcriptional regulator [Priestia taiwanensis]MBM7364506.1 DNA-binding transcriptional MerR regulator [Priestia taiwanensis]GGE80971.1 MerR family transcriptional regulator [Priestia taiwanensis]